MKLSKLIENFDKYLLIEGRKSNVAKKYPHLTIPVEGFGNRPTSILEFLMSDDPSGNHKYLMWMADTYNIGFMQAFRQGLMDLHPDVPFGGSRFSVEDLTKAYIKMAEPIFLKQAQEKSPNRDPELYVKRNMDFIRKSIDGLQKQIMKTAIAADPIRQGGWELFDYYETWKDSLDMQFTLNRKKLKVPSAQIVRDLAKKFHEYLPYIQNKDINSYKNRDALFNELTNANKKIQAKQMEKDKKKAAKAGARIIYEKGKVSVIRPETKEASCLFGKGTQWCISAERSQNYFDSYTRRGKSFYFFFFPGHPLGKKADKIALVLNPNGEVDSVWDSNDSSISLELLRAAWERYSSRQLEEAPRKSKKKRIANDLDDFDDVLDLVKADTITNPVQERGIDKMRAEKILNDEFSDIQHEFDIKTNKEPLDQIDYIIASPTLYIKIPINLKLRRKLDRWEEMYDASSGNTMDDLLAMIDGTYSQDTKMYEYKNYISENATKLVTKWVKDNWPTNEPRYKASVSVGGDRDSETRELGVLLTPEYKQGSLGEDRKETVEALDAGEWRTFLKKVRNIEKMISEENGFPNALASLRVSLGDLLADAGLAEPFRDIDDSGQTEFPFDYDSGFGRRNDDEEEEEYRLQEHFKRWLK